MTAVPLAFSPNARAKGSARFDEFIAWAEPFGQAGLNESHDHPYRREVPWFQYASRLIPHSHDSSRSWFIRHECIRRTGIFTKPRDGSAPEVRLPSAVIRPGRYLNFAKAYLNVSISLYGIRSIPKAMVRALIALEKALRDLNGGSNDPSNLSRLAFQRAAMTIKASKSLCPSKKYDVGKALERLAANLQSGQRAGTIRGSKIGFNLLETSFPFKSPIKAPPRFGKLARAGGSAGHSRRKPRLTGEHVAAVGLAYRRAKIRTGEASQQTFVASLLGVTLTTVSMRASELQLLTRDGLFRDTDRAKRLRLRLSRPKIGAQQTLPIPKRLEDLALEMFGNARRHSEEASKAFAFYVERFQSFAAIDELFIPDRIKPLLESEYLTREQTWKVLESEPSDKKVFTQRFTLRTEVFVDKPGDVYHRCASRAMSVARIADVVDACAGDVPRSVERVS